MLSPDAEPRAVGDRAEIGHEAGQLGPAVPEDGLDIVRTRPAGQTPRRASMTGAYGSAAVAERRCSRPSGRHLPRPGQGRRTSRPIWSSRRQPRRRSGSRCSDHPPPGRKPPAAGRIGPTADQDGARDTGRHGLDHRSVTASSQWASVVKDHRHLTRRPPTSPGVGRNFIGRSPLAWMRQAAAPARATRRTTFRNSRPRHGRSGSGFCSVRTARAVRSWSASAMLRSRFVCAATSIEYIISDPPFVLLIGHSA